MKGVGQGTQGQGQGGELGKPHSWTLLEGLALKRPDRRTAPEGRGSCCLAAPRAPVFTQDEADHGAQRLPHPHVER